ncbi:MAG: hypothetical protein ACFB0C_19710 [Leptolyngbyaceae cyanobacterium]
MRHCFDRAAVALVALQIAVARVATESGRNAVLVRQEILREAISQVQVARPDDTRAFVDRVKGQIPEEIHVAR